MIELKLNLKLHRRAKTSPVTQGTGRGGPGKFSRSENFLEKQDAENSGGDVDLSPRLVGICRKKAAGFPQPSFRDSPFLYPVFAIITGVLKHLFTEPPSKRVFIHRLT